MAGLAHLVAPDFYVSIVPAMLPSPHGIVLVSGVLEILGGVALLVASTRAWAAIGLIVLLILVLPANLQMLVSAHASGAHPSFLLLLWLRLPLQAALIWWVWRAGQLSRASIPPP
ncbi:hypothetical protein BH23GEM8_BH23GEM8_15260 [soil metagenome]